MTEQEYYISESAELSLLSYLTVESLDLSFLHARSIETEANYTVALPASSNLLWVCAVRINVQKQYLEFASLSGSIKVSSSELNTNAPIHVFLIKQDQLYETTIKFDSQWKGLTKDGSVLMQARKDSLGVRSPIYTHRIGKSSRGKQHICFVWLHDIPTSIELLEQEALVKVQEEVYRLDSSVTKALLSGLVSWVLPDENGCFTRQEPAILK